MTAVQSYLISCRRICRFDKIRFESSAIGTSLSQAGTEGRYGRLCDYACQPGIQVFIPHSNHAFCPHLLPPPSPNQTFTDNFVKRFVYLGEYLRQHLTHFGTGSMPVARWIGGSRQEPLTTRHTFLGHHGMAVTPGSNKVTCSLCPSCLIHPHTGVFTPDTRLLRRFLSVTPGDGPVVTLLE